MASQGEAIDVQDAGSRPLLWEELRGRIRPAEVDEIERVIGSSIIDRNAVRTGRVGTALPHSPVRFVLLGAPPSPAVSRTCGGKPEPYTIFWYSFRSRTTLLWCGLHCAAGQAAAHSQRRAGARHGAGPTATRPHARVSCQANHHARRAPRQAARRRLRCAVAAGPRGPQGSARPHGGFGAGGGAHRGEDCVTPAFGEDAARIGCFEPRLAPPLRRIHRLLALRIPRLPRLLGRPPPRSGRGGGGTPRVLAPPRGPCAADSSRPSRPAWLDRRWHR